MQYRNGKGCSLAGAGLGNGKHILSPEDGRNGFKLDIGGLFKSKLGNACLDSFCNMVLFKLHSLQIYCKGHIISDKGWNI